MHTYRHKQTHRSVRAARIKYVHPGRFGDPTHVILEGDIAHQLPSLAPMGIVEAPPEAGDYVVDSGTVMANNVVFPRVQFEAEFEPAPGTPPFPGAVPAPGELPTRVTKEALEAMFAGVAYEIRPDGRTTVCEITFKNGFTLRDEDSCIDPSIFDAKIGEEYAYKKALALAWGYAGFLLMEDRYRAGKA